MPEIVGKPARDLDPDEVASLSDDIAALRKSCEWLVTLGAVSVIGNVLKLSSTPATFTGNSTLRRATFLVIFLQLVLALIGALQFDHGEVDRAEVMDTLKQNRGWRYRLRNASLVLLIVGFVLLGIQNW